MTHELCHNIDNLDNLRESGMRELIFGPSNQMRFYSGHLRMEIKFI